MEVTSKSLLERYDAMNTEALADLYHAAGMTDLAVSVLKDVITSREIDWTEFITPSPTKPESLSDWELWKIESKKAADKIRLEPIHEGYSEHKLGAALLLLAMVLVFVWAVIEEPTRLWGLAIALFFAGLGGGILNVRNAVCPTCRRWFAFTKTGETRSITQENLKRREEERVCTHCGHRNWVEIPEYSSGGYVGSGDDGGCGAGGE